MRVLIEGNVFDGSWTDGQSGGAITLMGTNQGGNCRWCRVTDVTFRRNLVRNNASGLTVATYTNPIDTVTQRMLSTENVWDIGAQSGGDRRGIATFAARKISLVRELVVGNLSLPWLVEGGGFCTVTDNVWQRGNYGVAAGSGTTEGVPSLDKFCGSANWSWSGMTVVGSQGGNYPSTTWVASESQAPLAAQIRSIVQQATQGVIVP